MAQTETTQSRSAETFEIAPHHTKERRQLIEDVIAGRNERETRRIDLNFDWLHGDRERLNAFRRLLLHTDQYINVFWRRRLSKNMGASRRIIHGLWALSLYHKQWKRPVEAWHTPVAKAGHPRLLDQFITLVHHLLGQYEMPEFMITSWFRKPEEDGLKYQKWYIHLANGGSMADLEKPIQLTHRMEHMFMHAPRINTIERNMRWAEVMGLGGSHNLAKEILKTRLGRNHENTEFWSTVVQFLVNNAMMDPVWVGPIVDYISHMKFTPRRIVQEGGGVVEGPPPHPNFTMKGRSATKLMRQIEDWHGELGREQNVIFQSWQPSGVRPWEVEEETEQLGKVRWTVQEMLSSWELAAHGRAMSHCVVSYSDRCADGRTAIWSINALRDGEEERQEVLTVAMDIRSQTVTQARGRHNMLPNQAPKTAQAKKEGQTGYFDLLNRSNTILNQWMQRERLTHDGE